MTIGVPKAIEPGERRVALVPDAAVALKKIALDVLVEAGAGAGACFSDADYEKAGARIVADATSLFAEAEIVVKLGKPAQNAALQRHEIDLIREGTVLISFLQPMLNLDLVRRLAERRIT